MKKDKPLQQSSTPNYQRMSKTDLKAQLKKFGLPISGTAKELTDRLRKKDREQEGQTSMKFYIHVPSDSVNKPIT